MSHKIDPCVTRKSIYKNDVVFMTILRYKKVMDPKHLNGQDQKDAETQSH
jgi:hypothetical protein